ncbi:MAG: hypothetical protein AAF571_10335 [Verrucomicrobiota bacterium]
MNNQELQLALANKINENNDRFELVTETLKEGVREAQDIALSTGILLLEAQGQNRLGWNEWVEKNIQGMPKDRIKRWMTAARKESLSQKQELLMIELMQINEREPQSRIERNIFSELIHHTSTFQGVISKVSESCPIDKWDQMQKEKMKMQLEPLIKFYEAL